MRSPWVAARPAGRDDDGGAGRVTPRVGLYLVEYRTVRCDQRANPVGIEDVERGHDVAAVALLQDVGVTPSELREYPMLPKLDAVLIVVRLA
jgi:hypothetical protein